MPVGSTPYPVFALIILKAIVTVLVIAPLVSKASSTNTDMEPVREWVRQVYVGDISADLLQQPLINGRSPSFAAFENLRASSNLSTAIWPDLQSPLSTGGSFASTCLYKIQLLLTLQSAVIVQKGFEAHFQRQPIDQIRASLRGQTSNVHCNSAGTDYRDHFTLAQRYLKELEDIVFDPDIVQWAVNEKKRRHEAERERAELELKRLAEERAAKAKIDEQNRIVREQNQKAAEQRYQLAELDRKERMQAEKAAYDERVEAQQKKKEFEELLAQQERENSQKAEVVKINESEAPRPASSIQVTQDEKAKLIIDEDVEKADSGRSQSKNQITEYLEIFFWGVLLFTMFGVIYAGASNTVVIYYDFKDMFISILALVTLIFAAGLFNSNPFESSTLNWITNWIGSPVVGILGLFFLALNFVNAIKHNRSIWLGLFIGVFKLIYVVFAFCALSGQYDKTTKKDSTIKDFAYLAIALAVFYFITKAIVNGPAVYRAKGWV